MATVSMMVCSLCGEEAAETLITMARWESFSDGDGQTRYVCPPCAQQHRRRRQLMLAAIENEELADSRHGEGRAEAKQGSFFENLIDAVLGRR